MGTSPPLSEVLSETPLPVLATRERLQAQGEMTGLFTKRVAARALFMLALVLIGSTAFAALAWADGPWRWQIGMQPPATPVKDRLTAFHDEL